MIIYYSGSCGSLPGGALVAEPESVLGDKANVMLSFYLIKFRKQEQHKRFRNVLRARRAKNVQSK